MANKFNGVVTSTIINPNDNSRNIVISTDGADSGTETVLNFVQTNDRTITFPDITDTVVTRNNVDQLANKSLLDNSTDIISAVDNSQKMNFNISGDPNSTTTLKIVGTGNSEITLPANTTDTIITKNNVINSGTAGISLYDNTVVGPTIAFKKINAQSNKFSITEMNGGIDVDIVTGSSADTVAIGNDARFSTANLINVKLNNAGAGEYTSIAAAVNSITDSGPTSLYVVKVGPGIYTEPEIIVPPYVGIQGSTINETIVQANGSHHLFRLNQNSELSFMTIRNVQLGFAAIACIDSKDFTQVHKVSIYDSDTAVLISAATDVSTCYLEYVDIDGAYTNGIVVESVNDNYAYANLENFYTFPVSNVTNHVKASGSNWGVDISVGHINGIETETAIDVSGTGELNVTSYQINNCDVAVYIEDGVDAELYGLACNDCNRGILVGPGSPPDLKVSDVTFSNCVRNIQINNLMTTGFFVGNVEYTKTFVNRNTPFSIKDKNPNVISVSPRGGDFTSIGTAISNVNPIITANLTIGSPTITSSGLFSPVLDSLTVLGTNVPPNTTAIYVDDDTMTLSNNATNSITTSLTFTRATNTTPFLIKIEPGTYIETDTITVPQNTSVIGEDQLSCVVIAGGDFDLFHLSRVNTLANLLIAGTNPNKYGIVMNNIETGATLNNLIFSNCSKPIYIDTLTQPTQIILKEIICSGNMTTIFTITDNGSGQNVETQFDSITFQGHADTVFSLNGPNVLAIIQNSSLISDGTGNCFNLLNGAQCNARGIYVANMLNGFITGDNINNNPSLTLSGILFDNNNMNINITNSSTIGHYDGVSEYSKTFINSQSSFFISNEDQKIVTVAKKGGDFNSIKDAINAITDAAATNCYIISVGPGIFFEDPLVMKPFISIIGSGYITTTIFCINSSGIAITTMDAVEIRSCTVTGAFGAGGIGIYHQGNGMNLPVIINNCVFGNCETLVHVNSTQYAVSVLINNCLAGGLFNFVDGFKLTSTSGLPASLVLTNNNIQNFNTPTPQSCISADGPGTLLTITSSTFQIYGTNNTTGIELHNGVECRIVGSLFRGLENAITTTDNGVAPILNVNSSTFINCDTNLSINHPDTIGQYVGSIDITKAHINTLAPFFIRDRDINVLIVSKKGSDYNTIVNAAAAVNPQVTITTQSGSNILTSASLFNISLNGVVVMASGIPISTIATYVDPNTMTLSNLATQTSTVTATFIRATMTNPFVILVKPGIYVEDPITLPSYVSLLGEDQSLSIIQPNNSSQTLLTLSNNGAVENLSIQSVSQGMGILIDSVVGTNIQNCSIKDCETGIKLAATTGSCDSRLVECEINGIFVDGILIDGTANSLLVETDGLIVRPTNNTVTQTGINILGPNSNVTIKNQMIDGNNITNGQGIVVSNGAVVSINSCEIRNCSIVGFQSANIGTGPLIAMTGVSFQNNTQDIQILHPNTGGVISAIATRSKVTIDPASTLSVNYTDPQDNGTIMLGSIFIGPTNSESTDVLDLITQVPPMGLVNGGQITVVSGLMININAGFGYLTNTVLKRYEWPASQITLPSNSTNYIYVDSSGNLTYNNSKPATIGSILLGRVNTNTLTVGFIDASPIRTYHMENSQDDYNRTVFGSIFAQGSIVAANASRQLSVSSGKYYFSGNAFTPVGSASPLAFTAYYHSSSVWTTASQTVVDNTQYDTGVDLVALTAGFYVKHSLYLVGDGLNEHYFLVYGQAQYSDLTGAQNGTLPIPPTYFSDGVVIIASIIVTQANNTFTQINSQRPLPSFSAGSLATTLLHGNLLGLLNDDHPQYLLVNGTRAMSNDLNMGSNNITNVNLINNVDIATHAGRHLPNGADPIMTAAPITNLSANTTNQTGVANSLARSDHSHEILVDIPVTIIPDQSNQAGSSSGLARADHIHNISSAIPIDIGMSNQLGDSNSFSRSDHQHRGIHSLQANNTGSQNFGDIILQSGTNVQIQDNGSGIFTFSTNSGGNELLVQPSSFLTAQYTAGQVNINGTITTISANTIMLPPSITNGIIYVNTSGTVVSDIVSTFPPNCIPMSYFSTNPTQIINLTDARTFINNNVVFGSSSDISTITATASLSTGSSNRFCMADHVHAILTGVPSALLPDQANSTGTSPTLARADHIHNIPTASAVSISTANTQGLANTYSRSDHMHQGIHSLITTSSSQQSYGDIVLASGNDIILADNGTGTFTIATDGTSTNTASTLVKRDGTGNFSANNITIAGALISGLSQNLPVQTNATKNLISALINLVSQVTGILPVANGGTNSSTALLNNRVMVSNSGLIVEANALTNGQLLIGSTGNAPVAANLTSTGGSVTITNGPGSINLEATASSSSSSYRVLFTADDFYSPNNIDWKINQLASDIADPTNPALNVRSFVNGTESGVGGIFKIPSTSTSITFNIVSRPNAIPGSTGRTVSTGIYTRTLSNGPVPAWSNKTTFNNITFPSNTTDLVVFSQTIALSAFSTPLTQNSTVQFEFVRNSTSTLDLPIPWNMITMSVEFS